MADTAPGTIPPIVSTTIVRPISQLSPHDNDRSSNEPPPPKRRKILLACNACRERKSRCDGLRPTCSACEKRKAGGKCIYEETTFKAQQNIAILESRVKQPKGSTVRHPTSALTDNTSTGTAHNYQISPPHRTHLAHQHEISFTQDEITLRSTSNISQGQQLGGRSELRQKSTPLSRNDINITDPLTASLAAEEDYEHLFGKSSITSFIQSLKQTIFHSDGLNTSRAPNYNISGNSSRVLAGSAFHVETGAFSLPTRRQADRYMKCFWQYVHPVFPILHKQTFLATYQSLWLPEEEQGTCDHLAVAEHPIFLSVLNMVFAMGCQFSETIELGQRTTLTKQFYQQARKLFSIDDLDSVSLLTVQLLLLTGVFLHTTKYTNRSWNVIGLAIRNAQSLGLHKDNAKHPQSQIERETRRRVWFNCVIVDRLLAMTFGRPHMILPSSNLPLPQVIDDEFLLSDGEGQQPANTVSYLGLFVSSIKLFDIMSDVLAVCYNHKESDQHDGQASIPWWKSHRLDEVLKINTALDDFKDTLPNSLQIEHSNTNSWTQRPENIQWVQSKILECRFLYIRALLLRPLLLSAAQYRKNTSLNARKSTDHELGQRVAIQLCLNCIETIHKLVESIHSSLQVNYQSPGWVMHYAFSCAMVLVAAQVCSFPEQECSSTKLHLSWSRCIAIFEHYKERIASASYAMQLLKALQQRADVDSNNNGGAESNYPNAPDMEDAHGRTPQASSPDWFNSLPDKFTDFDVFNMSLLQDPHDTEQLMDFNWICQV